MSSSALSLAQRTERNHTVDSFRGFASVSVVFSHVYAQVSLAGFPASQQFNETMGQSLRYLFQGSSVYFMIITGFMLASQLPRWCKSKDGLFIQAVQRTTKILTIYWAALFILIAINLLRKLFVGNMWVPATASDVLSQFLFLTNFQTTPLYIPPAWYLQADIIIFTLVVTSYVMWNQLTDAWRIRLKPLMFLGAIPLLGLMLYIEALGLTTDLSLSVVRLMLYFSLGFLAYHSQQHKSALLAFIVVVVAMLICNDWTSMSRRFYTNTSIVLAFIFVLSRYSTSISSMFNQPWMKNLYRLNFAIFLLHWFTLIVGISLARHLAPNSMLGLAVVIAFTLVLLFLLATLFERYVQQPLLHWHNQAWAFWLSEASRELVQPVQPANVVIVQ